MRVDGTLMGIDEDQTSMVPKWKRGHFSILFDGATQPSTAVLVDWAKRSYVDVQKEKKKAKQDPDAEVPRHPVRSMARFTCILLRGIMRLALWEKPLWKYRCELS